MKKNNAIIVIEGQQWSGQDKPQIIRLTTEGLLSFDQESGVWVVAYHESEATGMAGTRTTVTVEKDGTVVLARRGANTMRMAFSAGSRHISRMETPYGFLDVGVYTHVAKSDLNEAGGSIHLGYTIDFNQQDSTSTRLDLSIRKMM